MGSMKTSVETPVALSVSRTKAAPAKLGAVTAAAVSNARESVSKVPACATMSRVRRVGALPRPAPERTYAKGAALAMEAPEPSEAMRLKGPDASSAGAAVKPPRPPGTTSALIQR